MGNQVLETAFFLLLRVHGRCAYANDCINIVFHWEPGIRVCIVRIYWLYCSNKKKEEFLSLMFDADGYRIDKCAKFGVCFC